MLLQIKILMVLKRMYAVKSTFVSQESPLEIAISTCHGSYSIQHYISAYMFELSILFQLQHFVICYIS